MRKTLAFVRKHFEFITMMIGGVSFYAFLILLQIHAVDPHRASAPENIRNVGYSYSGIHFYLSEAEDRPVRLLWYAFWMCFVLTITVAFVRASKESHDGA